MRDITLLLHARGESVSQLAKKAGVGRSHLHRCLRGDPIGGHTRHKVAPLLADDELACLSWDRAGTLVPRGTSFAGLAPGVPGLDRARESWRAIRWVALVRLLERGWSWVAGRLTDRRGRRWLWRLDLGVLYVRRCG